MGGGSSVCKSGWNGTILGYNGGGLVDEKCHTPIIQKIGYKNGSGSLMSSAKPMIKIHEGLRLDKYMDSRGFPTIGYGHLIEPSIKVKLSMPNRISQQKADELFDEDYTHHKVVDLFQKRRGEFLVMIMSNAMLRKQLIDLTFNMGPILVVPQTTSPKQYEQAFAAGKL